MVSIGNGINRTGKYHAIHGAGGELSPKLVLSATRLLDYHFTFNDISGRDISSGLRSAVEQIRNDKLDIKAHLGDDFMKRYSIILTNLETAVLSDIKNAKLTTGRERIELNDGVYMDMFSQANYMRNYAVLNAFLRSGGTVDLDLGSGTAETDLFMLFVSMKRGMPYGIKTTSRGLSISWKWDENSPFIQKVRDSLVIKHKGQIGMSEENALAKTLGSLHIKMVREASLAERLLMTSGESGHVMVWNLASFPRSIYPGPEHFAVKRGHGVYIYAGIRGEEGDSFVLFPRLNGREKDDEIGPDGGAHSEGFKAFSSFFEKLYGDRLYRAFIKYEGDLVKVAVTGLNETYDPKEPNAFFVRKTDLSRIALACGKAFKGRFKRVDMVSPFEHPLIR